MSTVDLVATWQIKLADGLHKVEFEHGTTTGKRVIRVDGKVSYPHRQLNIGARAASGQPRAKLQLRKQPQLIGVTGPDSNRAIW